MAPSAGALNLLGELQLSSAGGLYDDAAVLDALTSQYRFQKNLGAADIEGPIYRRPNSRVYRLRFPQTRDSLAAKFCLADEKVSEKAAVRQFTELSQYFDKMKANARYRVPEPIALTARHGALLMEWIDGEHLDEVLLRRPISTDQIAECLRSAGAWLRHFHSAGLEGVRSLDERELRSNMDSLRARLRREGVNHAFVLKALNALDTSVEFVSSKKVAHTWLHGDFQPSNVILAKDAVYGFDMSYATRGVGLTDVAHFLNDLEKVVRLPKGLRLIPALPLMVRSFEQGYFDEQGGEAQSVLGWFRLQDNLALLARHYRHAKSIFHRAYFVHALRISILGSLKQLSRSTET
jgi:tRNA A-37 threonylcarbamoyl transferase component Bud32